VGADVRKFNELGLSVDIVGEGLVCSLVHMYWVKGEGRDTNETIFAPSLRLPPPRVTIRSMERALQSSTMSRTSDIRVWGVMPTRVLISFEPSAFWREDVWVVFFVREVLAMR
jgi:hypothetical protein